MTGARRFQPPDVGPPDVGPRGYEVVVRGHLGETIRSAFSGLSIGESGENTLLTLAGADQAALYGLLAEAEALRLELLEVRRLPAPAPEAPGL